VKEETFIKLVKDNRKVYDPSLEIYTSEQFMLSLKNLNKGFIAWARERYHIRDIKLVEVEREVKEVTTCFGEGILQEDKVLKLKELEVNWANLLLEEEVD
jgi:hypothetical protein